MGVVSRLVGHWVGSSVYQYFPFGLSQIQKAGSLCR